jgi:N-hydroxyarylamine O-acetyltransferase
MSGVPDELDLPAYLLRIGYSGPAAPTLEVLTALHQAHVAAVPFENLDILLGRPIALDLPHLQAKLVGARRGGYCFEQNTLFAAALERVGFHVTALAARVREGPRVLPRNHMLLLVHLPEGPWVADVGFGGDGLLRPQPLTPGAETRVEDAGWRFHTEEGGLWVLEGNTGAGWEDLYAFTLEPQLPVDFEVANWYMSTYPRSPFVQSLTAQRSEPGRRTVLTNRELVRRGGGKKEASPIRDPEHLLEVLDGAFGLPFPPGTRFSRPEF